MIKHEVTRLLEQWPIIKIMFLFGWVFFPYNVLFLFPMYEWSAACVMCTMPFPGAHIGQKKVLDPLPPSGC